MSFVVFFFVLLADQFSKFLFWNAIGDGLNRGVSFGLMPGFLWVLIGLLLMLILFLITRSKFNKQALGLFFGGAVSNLVDRIIFEGIRDWLPIPFISLQNNLADWCIFIGVVWIVLGELQGIIIKQRNEREQIN